MAGFSIRSRAKLYGLGSVNSTKPNQRFQLKTHENTPIVEFGWELSLFEMSYSRFMVVNGVGK